MYTRNYYMRLFWFPRNTSYKYSSLLEKCSTYLTRFGESHNKRIILVILSIFLKLILIFLGKAGSSWCCQASLVPSGIRSFISVQTARSKSKHMQIWIVHCSTKIRAVDCQDERSDWPFGTHLMGPGVLGSIPIPGLHMRQIFCSYDMDSVFHSRQTKESCWW